MRSWEEEGVSEKSECKMMKRRRRSVAVRKTEELCNTG